VDSSISVLSRAKLDSVEMIIKDFAASNIVIGVDEIKAYTHRETEKNEHNKDHLLARLANCSRRS
jgi:hypothetical protein